MDAGLALPVDDLRQVEAVSIDDGCMDADGFIVWDEVKPAHYCGMRYRDRFVPAYDKPTRGCGATTAATRSSVRAKAGATPTAAGIEPQIGMTWS